MDYEIINSALSGGLASDANARVVKIMSELGGVSAAEIARLSGLSKSTVTRVVGLLREADVVVEGVRQRAGGRGRPSTVLKLNPLAGTCLGVLLGPNSVRVICVDVSHAIRDEREIELGLDYSVETGVEAARALIDASYAKTGLARDRILGVGIAVPGPVDPHNGCVLRSSMLPIWAGTDIGAVFEPALKLRIYADNEFNCAAIAEQIWGHGRGEPDFFYLKLDVGVGGAIVANGQVIRGAAGGAGEVGHMSVDEHGPLCRCGNRGCLELFAGWNAITRPARAILGDDIQFERIVEMAAQGHEGCRKLIADAAKVAGRGLANVCAVINPPLVIVGGRQLQAGQMLLRPLVESFAQQALIKPGAVGDASKTRIIAGTFSNHRDTLLGAVGLVLRRHGYLK